MNYLIALAKYSSYITFIEPRAWFKILKAPPGIYEQVVYPW